MLPRDIVANMASAANTVIGNALLRGSNAMCTPPRTEVGFVAAVTLGAIRGIAAAWTPLCANSGLLIELSGVFCHASPIVTFVNANGAMKRCELGDLLIVVDIITTASLVRRAALIQAKMARASDRVSLSGQSSSVQLELYQRWHHFDFEEAAYGMIGVNFHQGGPAANSGTFGVIDRHLKNSPRVDAARCKSDTEYHRPQAPARPVHRRNGDGARPQFGRIATPSLLTDWSKTVERLLTVTYMRSFNYNPVLGPTSARRGVSATVSACLNFQAMADQRIALGEDRAGNHPLTMWKSEGMTVAQAASASSISRSAIAMTPTAHVPQ